jgi:hypothetical protein
MKPIPITTQALVLRTDFVDEVSWQKICTAIEAPEPVDGFRASVTFISDLAFVGITPQQVLDVIPVDFPHTFLFIVDSHSLAQAETPVLVLDLYAERGRTFRVIPAAIWGVENNLSLANMDFREFADAVDADGVFRGF